MFNRWLVEYLIVVLLLFDHKSNNEHHVDLNKSTNDVQSQNPLFKKQSNLFRDIQMKQTMENTIDDLHRKSHQCPTFRTNICTSTQNNRIFVFPLDRLFTDNRIAHHHNQSYQYQRQVRVQLGRILLLKAFYHLLAKERKAFY